MTLTREEIAAAEKYWIKRVQAGSFPNGVKEESLLRLSPMVDSDGILQVDGRLRFADELSYDARCPVILPKNSHLTKLVILHTHESVGHGLGCKHTLTQLRSKFWVLRGRQVVRTIIQHCPQCRRRFSRIPASQKMAPLPKHRLSSIRAFEKIGVDYLGPFQTKQGRGKARAKRYLCLFTCLTTRAVHLEMAYSLDTDSFIQAFTRMT